MSTCPSSDFKKPFLKIVENKEEDNKKVAWFEARNEYIKTAFKGGIVKTEYTALRYYDQINYS